mmetsp:Transcript_36189/g.78742  ORF Transcript_36189/g.78742 Transcript_36189/m.78742 type:complete len:200 (+) Transcript_36189:1014-1613(+)
MNYLLVELLPVHPIIWLLVCNNFPQDRTEGVNIGLVVVGTTIGNLRGHISQTSRLSAHFVHIVRFRIRPLDDARQSKVDKLHGTVEGEAYVIRLQIAVEDHGTRQGRAVAVGHGIGNALGAVENVDVGELLLLPEASTPVADASVVSQMLRQRTTVEPFQHDEAGSLRRRSGTDQTDDVGMIELGMDDELSLNLVNGKG